MAESKKAPSFEDFVKSLLSKGSTLEKIMAFLKDNNSSDYDTISKGIDEINRVIRLNIYRNNNFFEVAKTDGRKKFFKLSSEGLKLLKTKFESSKERRDVVLQEARDLEKFVFFNDDAWWGKLQKSSLNRKDNFLLLDFMELARASSELAEKLLNEPDTFLDEFKFYFSENNVKFEDGKKIPFDVNIHVSNLPKSCKIGIFDKRVEHLNRLVFFEGKISQIGKCLAKRTQAKFECPLCGEVFSYPQRTPTLARPSQCRNPNCRRRGKFHHLEDEDVNKDTISLTLQEPLDEVKSNRSPSKIYVWLHDELTKKPFTDLIEPNAKVRIIGVLRKFKKYKNNKEQNVSDYVIEALNIEPIEDSLVSRNITDEEIKEFEKVVQEPSFYEDFRDSIFADFFGQKPVQDSLILYGMKGVRKKTNRGTIERDDIHILLTGDPGQNKTKLMKSILRVLPKGLMASASFSSAVGLVASAKKDDFLNEWVLSLGPVARASGGHCGLNEIAEWENEDIKKLGDAMEEQEVYINKADINKVVQTRTGMIATSNPKTEEFPNLDDMTARDILSLINVPSKIINRFSFIWILPDPKQSWIDSEIAEHITDRHRGKSKVVGEKRFGQLWLKKFFLYAQSLEPVYTEEALDEAKKYFIDFRKKTMFEGINARQLQDILRLGYARAKVFLREKVLPEDVKFVTELLEESIRPLMSDAGFNVYRMYSHKKQIDEFERESVMKKAFRSFETDRVDVQELIDKLVEDEGWEAEYCEKLLDKMLREGKMAKIGNKLMEVR